MLKSRRALVTGGAWFIGSHIVERLIREGCEVTALDDPSTGNLQNLLDSRRTSRLKIVKGDVRDSILVTAALKNIEIVFHEAAIVRSKREDWTKKFYEYATISIVQDGLRLCVYSVPVTLLDVKVDVVRKLVEEAEGRGVKVKLLSWTGRSSRSIASTS